MRTDNIINLLISAFLPISHVDTVFRSYSTYARLFLNRSKEIPPYTPHETSLLSSDNISGRSLRLQFLLHELQKKVPLATYSSILQFLTLLRTNPISADNSYFESRPPLSLINNNMQNRFSHKGSTPNLIKSSRSRPGQSSDSQSTHDYLSDTMTPASLWGPSQTSVSTIERGTDSRRAVRSGSVKTFTDLHTSIAEEQLLREVILCLSGARGTIVQFNPSLDAFAPPPKIQLSPNVQSNILRICECGWLHNRIRHFVDTAREEKTSGKLLLAFALAIDEHLSEYYRLVATLEAQLNHDQGVGGGKHDPIFNANEFKSSSKEKTSTLSSSTSTQSRLISSNGDSDEHQPLTLARLMLWLQEPKRRLKFLAALCDACAGKKGGAVASQVYLFWQHGCTNLHSVVHHALTSVAGALLEVIALWIYDGKLNDPNQEFFIAVNSSVSKERLWYEKYSIRKSMIPRFIDLHQARKILLIGKSVNFLMHICGESHNFKDQEAIRTSRLTNIASIFERELSPAFDNMVSTAYTHISKRLLEILLAQYHFMEHLKATRQFLLLGQGDFIQRLMDLLGPELEMPAKEIHLHHVKEIIDTAIRDTNAQYEEPEILQRLDLQMLEPSDSDCGWDTFSLEYIVDGPLSTIFTPDCRLSYLKAFNFLWRAKRMEFTLNALWRDELLLARLPFGLSGDLNPVLHVVQLLGSEIRHFVQQIQYYVNFEALECAWNSLVKKINVANDLDEVIAAHQTFLSNVIARCLLDAESRQLICQMRAIFDLIINFSQLHKDLEDRALEEHDIRFHNQRRIDETARAGKWGVHIVPEQEEKRRRQNFVEHSLGPLVARLRVLASSYRDMVSKFLQMLQTHGDASLRFLSQNLNFNSHYPSTYSDLNGVMSSP